MIWCYMISDDNNLENNDVIYENEFFFNEVILEFTENEWSEQRQSLLLYKAVLKLFKLSKTNKDPNFFINGLLYLNGLLNIINEKY